MRPRAALASMAMLASLLTTASLAEAQSPADALRAIYTEANRIVTDPTLESRPDARLVAVRALFSKAFDFRGAAERALSRQWQARSVAEQNDFVALFAGFVQRGFTFWLASVAAVDDQGGGITVKYLGETIDRDRAAVRAALGRRGDREVLLDHEMVYENTRWMVSDVTIDGISLVANYRAQFDRVIRGSSYRGLVTRLQERVSGELPRPASPPLPRNSGVLEAR